MAEDFASSSPDQSTLPPAPTVVPEIPEDQQALPQAAKVQQTAATHVDEPDPLMAGELPPVTSLPIDWWLVLLHAVTPELRLKSTMPQLYERTLGRQIERAIVRSDTLLVEGAVPAKLGYVCDAMPEKSAREFGKWAQAQIFTKRSDPHYYVECLVTAAMLTLPDGTRRGAVIVTPVTQQAEIHVVEGVFPVQFTMFGPRQDVINRARAARENPQDLITKPDPVRGTPMDVRQLAAQLNIGNGIVR